MKAEQKAILTELFNKGFSVGAATMFMQVKSKPVSVHKVQALFNTLNQTNYKG